MWFKPILYMAFIVVLVDCLGCVSKTKFSSIMLDSPVSNKQPKHEFHQQIETVIPLSEEPKAELRAAIFRPIKELLPKTLVIIVPGSGNVSRLGEVAGDGIKNYSDGLNMNLAWASSLADQGLFVLSYDKRTCTTRMNAICKTNDQKIVDELGIEALAKDLDLVFTYAKKKLEQKHKELRIVLMSTTQGAQTIAKSGISSNVSGIVLLSPIVSDLDTMWVNGLAHAAEHAQNESAKNRLLSQKESMKGFFLSLKRGDFPATSVIKGASIQFWQSWLNASHTTVDDLEKSQREILMLFSKHDHFSPDNEVRMLARELKRSPRIKITMISEGDRNFVSPLGASKEAVQEVVSFLKQLPQLSPAQ